MANLNAVLTRPKVSENYARNAFDRSEVNKLSYQLGGLTPFFCQPFIAGSHVKLNRSIFQRTAAVNKPAFPTVDTHCEFFAVPIRLLWSYWNNWKLNIQDFNSVYMGAFNGSGTWTPKDPRLPFIDLTAIQDNISDVLYNLGGGSGYDIYFTTKTEAAGANRLLDLLGYGFVKPTRTLSDQSLNFLVNPLKLLAYQKIYYDHFRNTAYESNDASYYNVDFWSGSGNNIPAYEIAKFCQYRYVNYRKDYFQALYPALNYVVSSPSGNQWTLPDSLVGAIGDFTGASSGVVPANVQNSGVAQNPVVTANSLMGQTVTYAQFTVQQLRAAFALDKLLRASAYAPKHVKDQFEARYGVKNVESGNESIRIGAYMNDIVFQEVTNTAQALGALGAKGVGSSGGFGKDIEFTCKEDTIIMGLMYSIPRSSYDSDRILNWNAKLQREDFFIPEYMNFGMQPLYRYEVRQTLNANYANDLFGYQDRYLEYKHGIDTNHGLFNSDMPLSDFVNHTNQSTAYHPQYGSSGVTSQFFKVKPTDLDAVFYQNTDVTDMSTDKFLTHITVRCICNQNMSVHGQPMNGGLG